MSQVADLAILLDRIEEALLYEEDHDETIYEMLQERFIIMNDVE
jgi:hypothetical protein